MKHTKEEILNALQIIKDECFGTECENCPFSFDDEHGISKKCTFIHVLPDEWEIKKKENEQIWRAFEP